MFAAVLTQYLGSRGHENVTVESAGYIEDAQGEYADFEWLTLSRETGIDLGSHMSQWIGNLPVREFDFIIYMEPAEVDRIITTNLIKSTQTLIANSNAGGIANPSRRGLDAYRECYNIITNVVAEMFPSH